MEQQHFCSHQRSTTLGEIKDMRRRDYASSMNLDVRVKASSPRLCPGSAWTTNPAKAKLAMFDPGSLFYFVLRKAILSLNVSITVNPKRNRYSLGESEQNKPFFAKLKEKPSGTQPRQRVPSLRIPFCKLGLVQGGYCR